MRTEAVPSSEKIEYYEISEEEASKCHMVMGQIISNWQDRKKVMATQIIGDYLSGSNHIISRKNHQTNNSIPSGSPTKYSKKQLSEALQMRDRYTYQEIANITGICKRTLLRASKKMQI
ncbi:hypothetical protein P0092_11160 [Ruminiclostridium papyrosolvens DSM 2782]|uniref:hypothetical protein n=1 Tax=Ruminiclostridium papyrosolvens TaxID=29362 RepID=UPI0010396D0F|nr:hypothetical protein [Ruminiclostridium papyrosolvens]WES36495.1 hypothetical protein P0092_11160 [Ruminiclostridium papyrosolvens DSM 2782]